MLELIAKTAVGVLVGLLGKSAEVLYEVWAGQPIQYRDTIKLAHVATGGSLHSHFINYSHPGTSGQQQVTVYHGTDSNAYWIVKGPNGQPEMYKEGQPIRHGDLVRLEHLNTQRNLHSHGGTESPLTRQQEVTAYGEGGNGDDNDNWRIEVQSGNIWRKNVKVKLIHANTQHALHSHPGHAHPDYTAGQQEVTGYRGRDDNDWWQVID